MNRKVMKYNKSLITVVILILALQNIGFAQKKSKCFEKIQDYYDDMAKIGFPEGKKIYYFHYRNDSEIYDQQIVTRNKVHVHVYMSNDQMHNISDDIEIYQDQEDAFMVIKKRKMLIHSESSLKIDKHERLNEILSFQDSLFRHMELKNCTEVKGKDDKKYLIVDMKLDSLTNIVHRMRNIRFTYNLDEKSIKRVKFDYLPGQKMKSLTQTIVEMDLNHSRKMNKPVMELFFTSGGKLKPEYAGYRYIDKK